MLNDDSIENGKKKKEKKTIIAATAIGLISKRQLCICNLHFFVHFFAVVVAVDYNVILWSVTSQGFQNTKYRQYSIFHKFDLSKNPSQSKLSHVD